MYSRFVALVLAIITLDAALLVQAGIYVITPASGSTCQANQPCTVSWLDNGQAPLITSIGVATVGLYTGKQQLVQTLPPVDPSKTLSITFTPNPAAGPNDGGYYVAIASTTLKVNNGTAPYTGFSPFFTLTGMTGSFNSPLPSATSTSSIPASLTSILTASTTTSTITIGAPSSSGPATPSPPITSAALPTSSNTPTTSSSSTTSASTLTFPTVSSSSRLTTSILSTTSSSSTPVAQTSSASSGALARTNSINLSYLSVFIVVILSSSAILLS